MRFSLSMFPVDGHGRPDPLEELIEEIHRAGVRVRVRGGNAVVEGGRREVEEAVARAQRLVLSAGERRFALLLMEAPGTGGDDGGDWPGFEELVTRPSRN